MASKKIETEMMEALEPQEPINWHELHKKEAQESRERIVKVHAELSEPFPKEVERQLKKGGTSLTYIPVSEVINRLNKVLGFDAWSYEIVKCDRDALDPDFIVAHVRMTVYPDSDKFVSVTKDGFGGQKIKRTKSGEIVDLGDEFKGAVSDALKKAAQALGVGLYLARSEEAMHEEMMAEREAAEKSIDPEILQLWNEFVNASKMLDAGQKSKLNDFWNSYSGGRPKPTKTTASISDLQSLLQKAIEIYMETSENE